MSFEYPFIYFCNLFIKPSLILFWVIVVILISFIIHIKHTKKYTFVFSNPLKEISTKNELIILILTELIIIVVHFVGSILSFQDSLISPIANLYLKHDALVLTIILIAYLTGIFIIKSNAHVYFNLINKISLVAINTSLFFALATQQILLTWHNWIVVVVFLIASIILLTSKFQKTVPRQNNYETIYFFEPSKKYNSLFDNNKKHAKTIQTIIKSQKEESICICVCGKWGSGKTSVINGALDLIQNDESNSSTTSSPLCSNLYIRINALEIDSFDELFKYFYSNVKSYLRANGVYTGIKSEYQNFITSCIGNLTSGNISNLISNKLFNNEKNYRDNKAELDKLLATVLGEEKIIVIVDDIERCCADKIKQFVFFVKEIATFSKCISIFATDYEVLIKSFENENTDKDFFDKFFNYRINIQESDLPEMIKYYNKAIIKDERIDNILMFSINDSIKSIEDIFKQRLEIEENVLKNNKHSPDAETYRESINKRITIIKEHNKEFILSLTNPRKMAKIFHVYNRYVEILTREYSDILSDSKLQKYAKNIQLGKLLFLLSYAEICLPFLFNKIQNNGVYGYFFEINENIKSDNIWATHYSLDGEDALFTSLSIGLLLKNSILGFDYDYQHLKAHKFLTILINEPSELKNVVNGFTTKEQEYYNAIKNKSFEYYEEQELKHIVFCVVRDFCYKDINKGQEYLQVIFQYLHSKNISVDFIFDKEIVKLLSENLCAMEIIYNIYFKNRISIKISDNLLKNINIFSIEYGYGRFKTISSLLRFFNNPVSNTIEGLHEQFLISRDSLEVKIDRFIEDNNDISAFLDQDSDTVNKLSCFIDVIEQKVIDNGFGEYPDFKEYITEMKNSVNDINYFLKIQKSLSSENTNVKATPPVEIKRENISDWIVYFNNEINEGRVSDELIKSVSNFFRGVDSNSSIYLHYANIKELHEFLSKYYKFRRDGVLYYRRVLYLNSNNKQKTEDRQFK